MRGFSGFFFPGRIEARIFLVFFTGCLLTLKGLLGQFLLKNKKWSYDC